MSYGCTTTTPWPRISVDPDLEYGPNEWSSIYAGLTPHKLDPMQSAADFYLLFGIVNDSFCKPTTRRTIPSEDIVAASLLLGLSAQDFEERNALLKDSHNARRLHQLKRDAETMFNDVVLRADDQFVPYVSLACGGEIRHHQSIGNISLSSDRRTAWCQWPNIVEEYGTSAYTTMATMFREFDSDGFGGEKWAVAAELIRDRLEGKLGTTAFLNKQMFVDRIFTLQHNGGCFLNKLSWLNARYQRPAPYSRGTLSMPTTVLNFQSSNPPDIVGMFQFASNPVQTLVKEYLDTVTVESEQPVGWGQCEVFFDDPNLPSTIIDGDCEDEPEDVQWVEAEADNKIKVPASVPAALVPASPVSGGVKLWYDWTFYRGGSLLTGAENLVTIPFEEGFQFTVLIEVPSNVVKCEMEYELETLPDLYLKHKIKHKYPGEDILSVEVVLTLNKVHSVARLETPPSKLDINPVLPVLYSLCQY